MTQLAFIRSEIEPLNPCKDSMNKINSLLGEEWAATPIDAKMAVEKGVGLKHLIWVAEKLFHKDSEIARRLRMFYADCAAHVLHIFEKEFPNDDRPRKAILAARSGNAEEMKAARDDVWKASYIVDTRITYAASASAYAASSMWSLVYAACVLTAASISAGSQEKEWQKERFIQWFSNNPPEPLEI